MNRVRDIVALRDAGVCALCGIDCEKFEERTRRLITGSHPKHREYRKRMADKGWPFSPPRSFWDVDHIVPIVMGGEHALANLRTLCVPCHKRETARLAAERARLRAPHLTTQLPGVAP